MDYLFAGVSLRPVAFKGTGLPEMCLVQQVKEQIQISSLFKADIEACMLDPWPTMSLDPP